MSVQTFEGAALRDSRPSIFQTLGHVFNGIFAARAAQARFNELWYLSDAELAARGLKREDISAEVMKIFDAR
jgi:hypothetical protein